MLATDPSFGAAAPQTVALASRDRRECPHPVVQVLTAELAAPPKWPAAPLPEP